MRHFLHIALMLVGSYASNGQDSTLQSTADSMETVVINSVDSLIATPQSAISKTKDALNSSKINAPSLEDIFSLSKVLWSLIFILGGYFVLQFLTRLLYLLAEKSTKYRITIKGFVPVLRILGWVMVIFIVIVGVIQPPIATVLALSASIGVAVGFASQDILKNIFGGITILFDRPFKVGDKIQAGNHYGEVVEIGLRSTRIVTPDDSLVSIPNGELMNQSVSNANAGETNCQVVAEIYLPENVDMPKVRKLATEAAQVSKYIYLNKPIAVLFAHGMNEEQRYVKMKIKAYVMDVRNEFAFKSDMTEIVIAELIKEGILG
ncbi:MAG: mechanosensitive ion channel family protein [Cyclobacteriaceae bacterium]